VAIGALLGGLIYGHSMLILFLVAACIFLIVLVILYIWLPEDQNQSVRTVANAQTPFYQQFHILKVLRSYKSVLKDRNYMLMISGFSILMMGE
ncbi:hypothetical protein, partial [Pseudomonas aeruginosa]